jgi:hypothetical protein
MHAARIEAAARFVFTFLAISARYGRKTYLDFRVQQARREYLRCSRIFGAKRPD